VFKNIEFFKTAHCSVFVVAQDMQISIHFIAINKTLDAVVVIVINVSKMNDS